MGNKSKLLNEDVVALASSELKKLGSYGYQGNSAQFLQAQSMVLQR